MTAILAVVSTFLHVLAQVTFTHAQVNGYAPTLVECPTNLITRTGSPVLNNQTLVEEETQYLSSRRVQQLDTLWLQYISDVGTGNTGYNVTLLLNSSSLPKVSTAVSGGGFRASLYGAGSLSAIDSRNSSNIGGILQLSEYLAGLSGGSWMVSSWVFNGFPDLYSLVLGAADSSGSYSQSGWELDLDLLAPGGLLALSDDKDYYNDILEDVRTKANAGFPVSIVDVWGRALSYHFFNQTTRGNFYQNSTHDSGLLWSSMRASPFFGQYPIPIVVTTSRINSSQQTTTTNDTTVIPLENTQFEYTPWQFGSFDPTLEAHLPVEYTGTFLVNGAPLNNSACVTGFENAGFVIGSSAALFNAAEEVVTDQTFIQLIQTLGSDITNIQNPNSSIPLVANYPNSFFQFSPDGGAAFESAANQILQITDGGENGENVPLMPLLVKMRGQDSILAFDSSADTVFQYPNGTSLIATRDRIAEFPSGTTSFPPIPNTSQDFVDQGLNERPTFFGCNITSADSYQAANYPIVIYLPNAGPVNATSQTYQTNTSTFQLNYSPEDTLSFMNAAHLNAQKGFPSAGSQYDTEWPLCLKCAVIDRARQRQNINRSDACEACFTKYCWSQNVAASLANSTASSTASSAASSTASSIASANAASGFVSSTAAYRGRAKQMSGILFCITFIFFPVSLH